MPVSEPKSRVSFRLNPALVKHLRKQAKLKGVTFTDLVEGILATYSGIKL